MNIIIDPLNRTDENSRMRANRFLLKTLLIRLEHFARIWIEENQCEMDHGLVFWGYCETINVTL